MALSRSSRLERLRETIQRAVEVSPYYAEAYRGLDLTLDGEADLQRLPLLTRDALTARADELLARGAVPMYMTTTEGSSLQAGGSRPPLLLFKDEAEYLTRKRIQAAIGAELGPDPPILLHLVNLEHGLDPGPAMPGCFLAPLERAFHIHTILSLLRREFSFPGFSSRIHGISGPVRMVKALTLLLQEKNIAADEFEVASIACFGNQLTPRWRRIFESYWQVPVHDVYGLSEVPGLHAISCEHCACFHFSPLAHVEVLALNSEAPISEGIGRLVATSLYPLGAMQPMIRYDTNDLVEIAGPCPATMKDGFVYVGRRDKAVFHPEGAADALLISPIVLNAVLDEFPDVAIHPHSFLGNLGLRSTIGFQKWQLQSRTVGTVTAVALKVELTWSPLQFREAAARFVADLGRALTRACPRLVDLDRAGAVDFTIELLEPGSTAFRAIV